MLPADNRAGGTRTLPLCNISRLQGPLTKMAGRRPSGRGPPGVRIGEVVSSPCPNAPAVEACFPVSPSSPRLCRGGQGDGIPKQAARAKDVAMHVLNKIAARCSKGASGIVALLVVGK